MCIEAHGSTPDAAAAVWDAAADAAAATLVSEADMAACAAACTHMLLVLRLLLRYHMPSESEAEQQVQAQDNSSLSIATLACSWSVNAGSRLHKAGSKLEIIVLPWQRRKQLKPEERH
jgi:hypothetical protein